MEKKKRVAVIYGGQSFEHEVSMVSAKGVIQNIDPEQFEVIPVKVEQDGSWIWGDESVCKLQSPFDHLPNLSEKWAALSQTPQILPSRATRQELVHLAPKEIDVAFPLIHGVKGEDGCLQGLLEIAGIPYVGCGVLSSALGMDKHIAKELVALAGVPVGPYTVIRKFEWMRSADEILANLSQSSTPLFVKPANSGSSVGINKTTSESELKAAIQEAFLYDNKVLVEQQIEGREIELAVLENEHYGELAHVSIPGEIVPQHEFYSYEAKYMDPNGALLEIPAKLETAQIEQLQRFAVKVFSALECEGLARVDFFFNSETGQCYFNEINTVPGFTPISMYPKLWEASGVPYQTLLTRLLNLAIARWERKKTLQHTLIKPNDSQEAVANK